MSYDVIQFRRGPSSLLGEHYEGEPIYLEDIRDLVIGRGPGNGNISLLSDKVRFYNSLDDILSDDSLKEDAIVLCPSTQTYCGRVYLVISQYRVTSQETTLKKTNGHYLQEAETFISRSLEHRLSDIETKLSSLESRLNNLEGVI